MLSFGNIRPAVMSAISISAGLAATAANAQEATRPSYWDYGWGYGHMMYGGFWMIVFWGGLLILAFLLARWLAPEHRNRAEPTITALHILQERFARGEIDEAEYDARKRVLEKK